jgi:hypothetical protein
MSRATVARGRLGIASRRYPHQIEDRRRDLAEAKISDHIEKVLAQAPPLTDEQRERIAELLRPARKTVVSSRLAELDASAS